MTPPLGIPERVWLTKLDRVLFGDRLGTLLGEAGRDLLGDTDLDLPGMLERDLMGESAWPSVESWTTAAALIRCQTVDTSCINHIDHCIHAVPSRSEQLDQSQGLLGLIFALLQFCRFP